jgi:hypothetical protein
MISVLPVPALREIRDLVDFMTANALKLVQGRKEAIRNGTLEVKDDANDIMSLLSVLSDIHLSSADYFHLVKSNMSSEEGLHLTDEELVASTS